MASPIPAEQHATYSAIIDEILAASDLNTISAKRIRKGLQDQLGYDVSDQKAAITDLIMDRFGQFQDGAAEPDQTDSNPAPPSPSATPSSPTKRKQEDESDELSEVADPSPPKKKAKRIQRDEAEDDAAYARRLQRELDSLNARPSRGAAPRRKAATPAKKASKPKKKSKAKVGSDDDSDIDGADKPEKEKKGGFHKPMLLSEPLASLLDTQSLSRPQTVKQIWAYVKERDLQDPNDKRQIRCDDAMRAVFKADKVHMFTMNKILAQHLFPMDEEQQ